MASDHEPKFRAADKSRVCSAREENFAQAFSSDCAPRTSLRARGEFVVRSLHLFSTSAPQQKRRSDRTAHKTPCDNTRIRWCKHHVQSARPAYAGQGEPTN